jgi:hypothetical protein
MRGRPTRKVDVIWYEQTERAQEINALDDCQCHDMIIQDTPSRFISSAGLLELGLFTKALLRGDKVK